MSTEETGAELVPYVEPLAGSSNAGDQASGSAGPEDAGQGDKDWRLYRRALIADMVLRHVPYRVIGQRVGVSKSQVEREIRKIRAEWQARATSTYEEHVAESLAVLNVLQDAALDKALRGNKGEPSAHWTEVAMALVDRRIRLLGLDKPVKADLTVHVDLAAEKARGHALVDELRQRRERNAG